MPYLTIETLSSFRTKNEFYLVMELTGPWNLTLLGILVTFL